MEGGDDEQGEKVMGQRGDGSAAQSVTQVGHEMSDPSFGHR